MFSINFLHNQIERKHTFNRNKIPQWTEKMIDLENDYENNP